MTAMRYSLAACCVGKSWQDSLPVREVLRATYRRLGQSDAPLQVILRIQVTAVDRSPGTVSGCLVLGGALAHQWGAELAAEKVLPVLTPLLTSPSLSPGHFAAALQ